MERKINSEKGINYLCRLEAQRNASEAIKLDPLEERMLICLATAWHVGKEITVLEAMRSCSQMSSTTAHRRLKSLRKKGVVDFSIDEDDNRIKYVRPTDIAQQYFANIWQCIKDVSADQSHSHKLRHGL
jgi:DNA-binding MarR family transcriptional regulator